MNLSFGRQFSRVLIAVGCLVAVSSVTTDETAVAADPVVGSGSSFAGLLLDEWKSDVKASKNGGLSVNYQSTGSSQGRALYIAGNVDFAMSDIRFQADELARLNGTPRASFKYVPIVAGALTFMFNLKDASGSPVLDLRLTPRTVCRIFSEERMSWNDPEIQADNPQVTLPANAIVPVIRADGAGTSFVLSEYCIARAPDVWAAFVSYVQSRDPGKGSDAFFNRQPISNWPAIGQMTPQNLGDGIAQYVDNESTGANTIGYVEAAWSKLKGRPLALVKNPAGVFAKATPESITRALAFADPLADGTFKLDFNGGDPGAYFPSTYSYFIAQTSGVNATKGETMARFLYYSLTAGQSIPEQLQFARLPQKLIDDGLNSASQIPGAPPKPGTAATTTTTAATTTTTTRAVGSTSTTTPQGAITTTTRAGAPAAVTTTTRAGTTVVTVPGGGAPTATTRTGNVSTPVVPGVSVPVPIDPETGETLPAVDTSLDDATGEQPIVDPTGDLAGAPTDPVLTDPATGETYAPLPEGFETPAAEEVAGAPVLATDAAAPIGKPGPSNSDAIWTLLQGGALVGAGLMLNRTRTRSV